MQGEDETPPIQNGPGDLGNAGHRLQPGDLVAGRYRIIELLGHGAVGDVFLGEHTMLHKRVAIKVLSKHTTVEPQVLQRFQLEARAAANIEHPNVCAATDFGTTEDGNFFLVMEYVQGRTLRQELDSNAPLGVERSVHIADQLCSALARTHELGLVHRDLKPENLMLVHHQGDPDFLKILDFGIVRDTSHSGVGDNPRLTGAGVAIGTPAYMAPEQVASEDADARTDLYNTGLILFEMLSGTQPFEDTDVFALMVQHMSATPPRVRDVAGPSQGIPAGLDDLVAQLLCKLPEERPQSAEATRAMLASLGSEAPVATETGLTPIPPAAAGPGPDSPPSRLPLILGGVAAIAVVVAVALTFGGGSGSGGTDTDRDGPAPSGEGDRLIGPAQTEAAPVTTPAPAPPPALASKAIPAAVVPAPDAHASPIAAGAQDAQTSPIEVAAPDAQTSPIEAGAPDAQAAPTEVAAPDAQAAPIPEPPPAPVAAPREPEPEVAPDQWGLLISRHVVAAGMEGNNPVNVGDAFAATGPRIYCFIEADNRHSAKRTVTVVWSRDGEFFAKTPLEIVARKARWRTWATLDPRPGLEGSWRCDIRNSAKVVISRARFTITASGAP